MEKKYLGIVQNDPYLEPYEQAIRGRHDHAQWKISQLTQNGRKTLSEFASGYLYFGLHKTTEGWVFREWAPNATEIFLVGEFSDWLVAQGGTSVLTEVPEMFGAETILMNRCRTKELFNQTVSMINNFKEYFLSHGEPVGENPSPGNKAGGISTLEDKALGCTQKCGKAPVSGVMEYGDRLTNKGLNLLSAPGNDLVASTALASCGCHIVLFTTGRGTPFGTFVPTMKVATNPTLAKNKPSWVDFSAGQLVEGRTMQELVPEFIDKVLAVASGQLARNEENGYREISIFKNGVTL